MSSAAKQPLKENSALSKIRQKRAALKDADGGSAWYVPVNRLIELLLL